MYPVKNEVKDENVKTEQNVDTDQDYMVEGDVQKTIKTVYFTIQVNQVKQDHHKDIDKNVIRALEKIDTSYNLASIHYIYDKFK